jgi:uncharacterized membrane protein (UPF0127 family)
MSGRAWPLLLLLPLLACERSEPAPPSEPAAPRARVTIGVHVIDAELADTPERQQRGLSGRSHLAEGQGMLFRYEEPGRHGFWMPDMHFDIDILWIRAGRIVHVEANVPHDDARTIYRPSEPAELVLEVPAGSAARRGWRVGDAVEVAPATSVRESQR